MTRIYARKGCAFDGCDREHSGLGWCQAHYMQTRGGREPRALVAPFTRLCSIEGCERKHFAKGWCHGHYQHVRNGHEPTEIKLKRVGHRMCSFNGCKNYAHKGDHCKPHANQIKRGEELHPIRNLRAAGTGHIDSNGYMRRYVLARRAVIMEHRLVMEAALGRTLRTDEHIHHKNGVRNDNRIENLELWLKPRQPPGQRVDDLVAWAREILERYT